MNSNEWKCQFCGAQINPGDQVCMHCGNSIHNTNVSIQDLRSHENSSLDKKRNRTFLVLTCLAVLFGILVVFSVLWFGILKR